MALPHWRRGAIGVPEPLMIQATPPPAAGYLTVMLVV